MLISNEFNGKIDIYINQAYKESLNKSHNKPYGNIFVENRNVNF